MSVFGIGAVYDGTDDVSVDFLRDGVACIGYDIDEAPAAHALFRRITISDIIYIKSYPPKPGLLIKAVGVVVKPNFLAGAHKLGEMVKVDWRWIAEQPFCVGSMNDKADFMRRGTLHEELSPRLQKLIVDLLLGASIDEVGPAFLQVV